MLEIPKRQALTSSASGMSHSPPDENSAKLKQVKDELDILVTAIDAIQNSSHRAVEKGNGLYI